MTTAIVVVSHSARLAEGVCELAAEMAPDVTLRAVGGTDDGRIGTSVDRVFAVVSELLTTVEGVVLLTDIGSATMTAELVLEMLGEERVVLADAPLVEGAVVAAVAAQGGSSRQGVRLAAEKAALSFPAVARAGEQPSEPQPPAEPEASGDVLEEVLEVRNELGLHARPAAMLARVVADFEAQVEVNGADGASVLALMSLDLPRGAQLRLRASGPQAQDVLAAIARIVEDRFGEQ